MKILEIMSSIKDYLIKGFKSGIIPLAVFILGISSFFFLGSVGYDIFPTTITEGRVVKFSEDARSNRVYEVVYKVEDKKYETFGFVSAEKIEIGQLCKVRYYDFFPSYSKIVK